MTVYVIALAGAVVIAALAYKIGQLKERLLLTLSVTACAKARCDCPPWPVAGAAVAQELDYLPEKDFPALWEWLARLEKLRDQLN